MNLGLIGK